MGLYEAYKTGVSAPPAPTPIVPLKPGTFPINPAPATFSKPTPAKTAPSLYDAYKAGAVSNPSGPGVAPVAPTARASISSPSAPTVPIATPPVRPRVDTSVMLPSNINVKTGVGTETETPAQKIARLKKEAPRAQGTADRGVFDYKTFTESLPFGFGRAIEEINRDPIMASTIGAKELVKELPGAGKAVAQGFIKAPIQGAMNIPGALGVKIKFNVPGLGEVSNAQYRAAYRVQQGEDAVQVAIEEGANSILETLFFIGLASKPFVPRQTVVAKGQSNSGNIRVANPPKSFRLSTPPENINKLTPDAIAKLPPEVQAKINPDLPTFFRMKGGGLSGTKVTGEVVQLKPSYFEVIKGKLFPASPEGGGQSLAIAGNSGAAEKAKLTIQNSEGMNIEKSIADGSIPKDAVYKPNGTLQPTFAEGRIADISAKLDAYKPGLGKQFKGKIDTSNVTMESLKSTAISIIDQNTPKPTVSMPTPFIPKITPDTSTVIYSKSVNTADIAKAKPTVEPPSLYESYRDSKLTAPKPEAPATNPNDISFDDGFGGPATPTGKESLQVPPPEQIPQTLEEYNKLTPEQQTAVNDHLPQDVYNDLMYEVSKTIEIPPVNEGISKILSGDIKLQSTKDSKEYRAFLGPAVYRRIFSGGSNHQTIDEAAMDLGYRESNGDQTLMAEIKKALDARKEAVAKRASDRAQAREAEVKAREIKSQEGTAPIKPQTERMSIREQNNEYAILEKLAQRAANMHTPETFIDSLGPTEKALIAKTSMTTKEFFDARFEKTVTGFKAEDPRVSDRRQTTEEIATERRHIDTRLSSTTKLDPRAKKALDILRAKLTGEEQDVILANTYTDRRTGLYNQALYEDTMFAEKPQLSIDLRGMGQMNKDYGYESVNKVLEKMGELVQKYFPNEAFRWGGDEFVIDTNGWNYAEISDRYRGLYDELYKTEFTSLGGPADATTGAPSKYPAGTKFSGREMVAGWGENGKAAGELQLQMKDIAKKSGKVENPFDKVSAQEYDKVNGTNNSTLPRSAENRPSQPGSEGGSGLPQSSKNESLPSRASGESQPGSSQESSGLSKEGERRKEQLAVAEERRQSTSSAVAKQDWEDNYADEYNALSDKFAELQNQLKQAPAFSKIKLQDQIREVLNKQLNIENTFAEKWKRVEPIPLVEGDRKLYGPDMGSSIPGVFGKPSVGLGQTLADKAPVENAEVNVLARSSKDISVRRDARKVQHILSDRVSDDVKIKKLDQLRGKLESSGTPAGEVLQKAIDKMLPEKREIASTIKLSSNPTTWKGWLSGHQNISTDESWGTEHWQIKGNKPEQLSNVDFSKVGKTFAELVDQGKDNTKAEITGEVVNEDAFGTKKPTLVRFSSQDGNVHFLDKKAVSPILKVYPNAVSYIGPDKAPVLFKVGDENVAVASSIYLPKEDAITIKLNAKIDKKEEAPAYKTGADNAGIGTFQDGTEIKLGKMRDIKPIEFPELVQLARELSGLPPKIRQKMGNKLGLMRGSGGGSIELKASLFDDPFQASAVLAHEIGHLIDYLPNETLKRGNLLGRLLTLRSFFADTFSGVIATNKELRNEMYELSKFWRPFDEAKSGPSYIQYRKSGKEIYADSISMLFNNPGLVEEKAPTFYNTFFDYLDRKPAVHDAFFEIQSLLSGDRATLVAKRREGVRKMFSDGDYKSKELEAKRLKEKELRLKDFWSMIKYEVVDNNQGVIDRIREMEKSEKLNPDDNPIYMLRERNYVGGKLKAWTEKNVQPIYEALNEASIPWLDFSEALFYERIAQGDRSTQANPRGITPDAAKEALKNLKDSLGDRASVLTDSIKNFHAALKDTMRLAHKEGLIGDETWANIEENPAYVTFQVLDHLEEGQTAKVYKSVGTLKDINDVAVASIGKTYAVIKAIERNRATRLTIKALEKMEGEVEEAKYLWNGKKRVPMGPTTRDKALVTYMDAGKLRGVYVDPYVAHSVNNDTLEVNMAILKILKISNSKYFRPIFTTFNLGFQTFNVIRDFERFWKNIPGMTIVRALKLYAKSTPAAFARGFGKGTDNAMTTIQSMEEQGILSVTFNDLSRGEEPEDIQIDRLLRKSGIEVTGPEKPKTLLQTAVSPLRGLLSLIEKLGNTIETIPKVAGYYNLTGKYNKVLNAKERDDIRRYIGSPDFLAKGFVTPATNNVFLFSNAIIQGVRADYEIATTQGTRGGYWWKTAKATYLPKLIMLAALAGYFGDDIRKLMRKVSEYDLTNYTIIPLGEDENGKAIYIRIPQDETSRLLGGIFWKGISMGQNEQSFGSDLSDIASLFGGQIPSTAPLFKILGATGEYVAGRNPYDSFRGRNVFSDDVYKAGGSAALKSFAGWTFQQLGGGIVVRFYNEPSVPKPASKAEKVFNLPVLGNIIGRFVRVSDYGEVEKINQIKEGVEKGESQRRLNDKQLIYNYIEKVQGGKMTEAEALKGVLRDSLGEAITPENKDRANTLKAMFLTAIKKSTGDYHLTALTNASSNAQKATMLRKFKTEMTTEEFEALKAESIRLKIVNPLMFAGI